MDPMWQDRVGMAWTLYSLEAATGLALGRLGLLLEFGAGTVRAVRVVGWQGWCGKGGRVARAVVSW